MRDPGKNRAAAGALCAVSGAGDLGRTGQARPGVPTAVAAVRCRTRQGGPGRNRGAGEREAARAHFSGVRNGQGRNGGRGARRREGAAVCSGETGFQNHHSAGQAGECGGAVLMDSPQRRRDAEKFNVKTGERRGGGGNTRTLPGGRASVQRRHWGTGEADRVYGLESAGKSLNGLPCKERISRKSLRSTVRIRSVPIRSATATTDASAKPRSLS